MLKFLRDAAKLKKKSINELRQAMESPSSLLDSRVKKLTSPNDWTENGLQPTLILVGPADLKKVQAVKEMAVRLNWHILIVDHEQGG